VSIFKEVIAVTAKLDSLVVSAKQISTSVRTAHAKTEPPASISWDLTAAIVNLVTLAATAIQT